MSASPPDCEHLELAARESVLHVTINRPAQRNALARRTVTELIAAVDHADACDELRVLILRGAGGHFCAGGDVRDMAAARGAHDGEDQDPLVSISRAFGEMCVRFADARVAVVAVLEGAVLGGGFGLACVADVAIAAPSARFGLPETSLGIVPAQIAPFLVERLGYGEARRLAVVGGRIDAHEALRLGLVHEVSDDPDAAVARVTEQILACAPGAVATTKRLVQAARLGEPADLVEDAARKFATAVRGPEGVEGTMAFIEKRRPAWAPPE